MLFCFERKIIIKNRKKKREKKFQFEAAKSRKQQPI
jgi:hypothetical protein